MQENVELKNMSLICNILYISLWIISAINWLDLAGV